MTESQEKQQQKAFQPDQRENLRSPLLILKVRLDDGRKVFFGYTKNISRNGMFVASVNPREIGSRCQMEILLPRPLNQTVRCTCEVVWQRQFSQKSRHEPGMGIKFLDMPEDAAEAIDAWVKNESKSA
jgi:Tfp pilus assembly protein PilZ